MTKSAETNTERSSGRKRRWLFPLLAVSLGLAPFVGFELVLRLLDVGKPSAYVDPYFGFGPLHPLFDLDDDAGVYRLSRSRSLYFGDQQFDAIKGPRTFRVFCLGGSTVRGRPYTVDTSFARWLELELSARDPAHDYEVVNCGGLSYASYRLARILEEVIEYQPDLVVIATGHNEFLEDRTYADAKAEGGGLLSRLRSLRTVNLLRSLRSDSDVEHARKNAAGVMPGEVDTRLDQRSGYASYHRDPKWQADVVDHFEASLEGMVQKCMQAGVPLMLVRLGSNLRDCPPVKSEFAASTSGPQQDEWNRFFEQATQLTHDPEGALLLYQLAESIDDQYALLHYRMARCYDQLEEFDKADASYRRAKQLDICPLRILDGMQQYVEELAKETDTPLVDAGRRLSRFSPQQIAGNDAYVDHVHPSMRSHQRIARWIAEKMVSARLVVLTQPWSGHERRTAYRRHLESLRTDHFSSGRRRVGWLEGWANRSRMLLELVPADARGHIHLGQRFIGFDEMEPGWAEFEIALLNDPDSIHLLLDFGLELIEMGRPAVAAAFFERLLNLPHLESVGEEIAIGQLCSQLELMSGGARKMAMAEQSERISRLPETSRWPRILAAYQEEGQE